MSRSLPSLPSLLSTCRCPVKSSLSLKIAQIGLLGLRFIVFFFIFNWMTFGSDYCDQCVIHLRSFFSTMENPQRKQYVFRSYVRPAVWCRLTSISHDAVSLYLVERFQQNLAQIFLMRMRIAEKIFKVRGQISRSWPDGMLRWRRHAFRRCGVEAHWLFFFMYFFVFL